MLGGVPKGPDGVQLWSLVEHEICWPWFYVQVVQAFGDKRFRTMLMLPNRSIFEDVVSAQTDKVWLDQAYLVSPGNVNGTRKWRMEELLEVESVRNAEGDEVDICCTVAGGQKYYFGGGVSCEKFLSCELLFSAEFHLK